MNQSVRFILAVVMMVAVVIITNLIFPPVPRTNVTAADSIAAPAATTSLPQQSPAPATATPQPNAPATATPTAPVAATADTVVVESPLYRFGFSTQGAALVSAEMLKFKSATRDGAVQLAGRTPGGLISHNVRINGQVVDLRALDFTPSARALRIEENGGQRTLRFTHNSAQYGTIEIAYDFTPSDYVMNVHVTSRGPAAADRLHLNMGPTLALNEAHRAEDERALGYVVNSRDRGIENMPLRSLKEQRIEEGPLEWVALKNKYFVAAAVADTVKNARPFGGLIANDHAVRYAANLTATLPAAENGSFNYRLYVGPQEYERLVKVGSKLQDVNPMGWRVFRPILRPLAELITWALITIQRASGLAYGWVLILFGIFIRLAMWPLNAKAMRSQLKSMELQPRMKDLQARYKNEPEKLQKEMFKLYKEEGFNPMGGCLPMLIPMPVLITLFFVFQNFIEFRGVSFGWLPDLSQKDPLYILPIILGLTIFVQQLISMKTMPPNPQMKVMLYFMPAFMMIIFLNLASGLNLYYAAQNLPGFVQQLQLTKERVRYQRERGLVPAVGATASAPPRISKGSNKKKA